MEETCDLFFQVAETCSVILLAFVEKALVPMVNTQSIRASLLLFVSLSSNYLIPTKIINTSSTTILNTNPFILRVF